MENLPEELVTEVLSRLPAESILRFKSVCKSWYVLLTNPNFVTKHLANQHQSNNINHMFLIRRFRYEYELKHFLTSDDDMCILSLDNVDDPETVDLPRSIQLCGKDLRLIGHCDGLIALSDNNSEGIIVCNPATREFRILPSSSLGPIPYATRGLTSRPAYNNFLGFGYDYRIKDYKIVRAVPFFCYKNGQPKLKHRVEVFCIRTDSCWRELNVILILESSPRWTAFYDIREPYFDEVCYWWARDEENRRKSVLISFHIADEVFGMTPIPELEFFEDYNTRVSIGVYNNSIALYMYHGRRIDVWAMRELGVKESWSKQLTIQPFVGVRHLGFWNGSDKEFLYLDHNGQLAIYNSVTKDYKTLSLLGGLNTWAVVPYMKTVVSVKSRVDIASSCRKFHP